MNLGSGAALALPIAGYFWYKLSIDPKFAKITQEEFVKNEAIISEMNCPLRLGFSPDKYYAVMRDSTLKDSLLRTGFRGLKDIVEEMFPEEQEEELQNDTDGEGGSLEVVEETEEKKPEPKKPEPPKAMDPKPQEKKKPEEKPKDPPKKGF